MTITASQIYHQFTDEIFMITRPDMVKRLVVHTPAYWVEQSDVGASKGWPEPEEDLTECCNGKCKKRPKLNAQRELYCAALLAEKTGS